MANTTNSPNMNLIIPTVSVDPGPDWANNINASLAIIDQHNHSAGSGVQIPQSGINLTPSATTFDSLSFNASNAYALRSARFTAQNSPLALAGDVGCLYVSGLNLFYNDGSGNQIQITSGGGINATGSSLVSGTASASFSGGVLVVDANTNLPANIQSGSILLGNNTVNSKYLTLQPPNAMASNFALTLPNIPSVQSIMAIDTFGNISGAYVVDNSTIVISSGTIEVPSQGITATQIANNTITRNQTAAIGQQISSSCGFFSTSSSSSFVAVTNLSVTITTTGKPVMVFCQQDGSGNPGSFSQQVTNQLATFEIQNELATVVSRFQAISSGVLPPSSALGLDIVAAGTHTYTVYALTTVSGEAQATYMVLVAYELF